MPYETGTANGHLDLLDKLRRFAAGYGVAGAPVAGANTGNGTVTAVDTHPASVSETITLTCTATAIDGGTFSVIGSVSGALPSATVGVPYTSAVVDFTVNDGTVDFALGDTFTIAITQGVLSAAGQAWTVDRWSGGNELILHGPGLAGSDAIYVGVRAFQDIGVPYFNWGVRGAVGFDAGLTFANQPGVSPETYVLLDDDPMTYWFVGSGRRIVGVVKVGAVYQGFYLGLFLPYATPTEYPYPIMVGGTHGTSTKTPADTYTDHRLFFDPGANCLWLRGPGGTWYAPRNYGGSTSENNYTDFVLWPYQSLATVDRDFMRTIRDNADGSYTLFPIMIAAKTPIKGLLGELDGCHYCSGFSRAAEDIVQIGGVDHLLVQNVFRTERYHFMALRLE